MGLSIAKQSLNVYVIALFVHLYTDFVKRQFTTSHASVRRTFVIIRAYYINFESLSCCLTIHSCISMFVKANVVIERPASLDASLINFG